MRLLTLIIALLLVMIQYPLWLGKGGWFRTWELERTLAAQNDTDEKLRTRNVALDAEVQDLKSGTDAIEERARFELGMIRDGEAFVQIVDASPAVAPPGPAPVAAPVPTQAPSRRR